MTEQITKDNFEDGIYTVKFTDKFFKEAGVRRCGDNFYLLTNNSTLNGARPPDRDLLGFRYSWTVSSFVFLEIFPLGATLEEINKDKIVKINKATEENKKEFVQNVLNYIDSQPHSGPLVFSYGGEVYKLDECIEKYPISNKRINDFLMEKRSELHEIVIKIFWASRYCASCNKENLKPETSEARARSPYDVWRHCLSIDPNITIFDVLTTIQDIARGTKDSKKFLSNEFCPDVQRTVHSLYEDPNPLSLCWEIYLKLIKDEFGNYYNNWDHAVDLYDKYLKEQKEKK